VRSRENKEKEKESEAKEKGGVRQIGGFAREAVLPPGLVLAPRGLRAREKAGVRLSGAWCSCEASWLAGRLTRGRKAFC